MQLSEFLLEKLNSDVQLGKRIQLARNVFITDDVRIAYKEEHILTWLLEMIQNSKNDNDKSELISGFCFCVNSSAMTALPASGIRSQAKSHITKSITKILKSTLESNSNLLDAIHVLLKKFSLHYKLHFKQFVKVLFSLMSLSMTDEQYSNLLVLTADIFKNGALHEKFVLYVLERDFHILFKSDGNSVKENILVQFLQRMLFKKELFLEFQKVCHGVCSEDGAKTDVDIVKAVISALHNVYTLELDANVKKEVFCKVFESFVKSCGSDESSGILRLFVIMCHLTGLEQDVNFPCSTDGQQMHPVVNKSHFQECFNAPSATSSEASYVIVNALIRVLSSHSVDLNTPLFESTYVEWFQSLCLVPLREETLSSVHLDFYRALGDLNTFVIEKNFTRILSHALTQSKDTFECGEFALSFNLFSMHILEMYSKLQRIQKFITKLLHSVRKSKSDLTQKNILFADFLAEFSNIITLLPSTQALGCMDDLQNTLENNCVKTLEENSGTVNVLLIQVTCSLLSEYLSGVRVLSHTIPQNVLKTFIEKMQVLKGTLGRFGKALLVRIHDREIVQPFLNLCYHWGELELLIAYYASDHAESMLNKDISPTDLSGLHSYLTGEEWNVLAERVSNFGAVQCYQVFLKLILQKLRTLHLRKCHSLINGEATSKHILTQLTSELYKHRIIDELTPEDVTFILAHLTQVQSRLLLEKLYMQALESDSGGKLLDWLRDSMLLEHRNFVILSVVVVLQNIGSHLSGASKHNGAPAMPYAAALSRDFLDDDFNVNPNKLANLFEDLSKLLREPHILKAADRGKLGFLVEVLKSLPLMYMSTEVASLALAGLTFVAVVTPSHAAYFKKLLLLIHGLVVKIGRSTTWFNVGACLKWLLSVDDSSPEVEAVKNNLIRCLLRFATNSDKGLMELKAVVRDVKSKRLADDSKSLRNQILLYQDLGKSWVKSRKRSAENDKLAKYRKKLSKSIREEMKAQNELETPTVDPSVLVTAYGVELTRAIKLKKEERIVSLFELNFDKFFDIAVTKVKSGSTNESYTTFLTTVLVHMPEIKGRMKKNALKRIWNALKTRSKVDWKLFYRIADDEEYEEFLLDLLKMWRLFALGKTPKMNLNTYFTIWMEFYGDDVAKKKLYGQYVKRLFLHFTSGPSAMKSLSPEEMSHVLDFLRLCISTTQIVMTSSMLDAALDVMLSYDYASPVTNDEFRMVFESCVNAASWLFTTRSERVRDKIQNIFQLFVKLLDDLVRRSSVELDLSEEDLLALSSSSHSLEKWTSRMTKLRKDFSRVSVYFIAALVSSFVRVTIYPAVKTPLVNCINNFLSISDAHNVAHLTRALHPGSQQVFNGIYETYQRYYKFTGKV